MSAMIKNTILFQVLAFVGLALSFSSCGIPEAGPSVKSSDDWVLQFSDNFEREELGNNWSVWSGNWHIKDGWLTITKTGWGGSDLICTIDFPGSQRLEYDAMSDNPGDLSGVLNTSKYGVKTGYFIGFGSDNNTLSKLRIEGERIEQWDAVIIPQKVHHIIVERDGNILRQVIDGQTTMTYKLKEPLTDEHHQRIGLYVFTEGQFDNVRVYTKPN